MIEIKKIRVPVTADFEEKLKKARNMYMQIHNLKSEDIPLRRFYAIIMQDGLLNFEDRYNRVIK